MREDSAFSGSRGCIGSELSAEWHDGMEEFVVSLRDKYGGETTAVHDGAADHQKAWFADLRRDVFEARKPYAIAQADMPLELFQVMQVPVVTISGGRDCCGQTLTPYYLDQMNAADITRLVPLLQHFSCDEDLRDPAQRRGAVCRARWWPRD